MCGICGIYKPDGMKINPRLIEDMYQTMQHRGPDDQGLYVDENIALGMRRLSIIDLHGGAQPIYNEDRTVAIILNGEIYNFHELRMELINKGHLFKTKSDTETVVHLYEEYGINCLNYLRGMFAFAIWDARLKRLFIARDRIGIKPLYYALINGFFIFASEMKAILQFMKKNYSFNKEIDYTALNHYLLFQYIPGPRTIFKKIKKLLPGNYIIYGSEYDSLKINSYWQLPYPKVNKGGKESYYIEKLDALLEESIKLRLISDVPLGVFLSGGIDSSTIVAKVCQLKNQKLKTFSIGFKDQPSYDETKYARQVSSIMRTDHYELLLDGNSIEYLPKLIWHLDEPFADRAALPTFLLSKLAREHVTVALSGEGGDEMFGGYRRYIVLYLAEKFHFLPSWLRNTASILMPKFLQLFNLSSYFDRIAQPFISENYLGKQSNLNEHQIQELCSYELMQLLSSSPMESDRNEHPLNLLNLSKSSSLLGSAIYFDTRVWLPDNLLTKVDRMSMAVSLEARVPYLDHKLVEFAFSAPLNLKINNLRTKYIFKKVSSKLLPKKIVYRRKQPFNVPLRFWFQGRKELLHDILLSSKAKSRGYFNYSYLENMINSTLNGKRSFEGELWNLLCLELWHLTYIDSVGISPISI